jgi:phospholipase/carboxylesterase
MALQAISLTPPNQPADQLLVLLHGWGANARDVAGLAPYLNLTGYQMLFPDGPFPHPMAPGGRMWYSFPVNYDFRRPHDFEQQADLQTSRQQLREWLQALPATTGIPLENTILGGFSQGGAMTLDIGLQLPLAGMMVLSGYCHAPLTKAVSDRPILIIHGRQDPVVPLEKAQTTQSELTALGMTVTYHEFDMGHELSLPAMEVAGRFCQHPEAFQG